MYCCFALFAVLYPRSLSRRNSPQTKSLLSAVLLLGGPRTFNVLRGPALGNVVAARGRELLRLAQMTVEGVPRPEWLPPPLKGRRSTLEVNLHARRQEFFNNLTSDEDFRSSALKAMKQLELGTVDLSALSHAEATEFALQYLPLRPQHSQYNFPISDEHCVREHIRSVAPEICSSGVLHSVLAEHVKYVYTDDCLHPADEHGYRAAKVGTIIGMDETGINAGQHQYHIGHPPKHGVDGQRDLDGLEKDGDTVAKRKGVNCSLTLIAVACV